MRDPAIGVTLRICALALAGFLLSGCAAKKPVIANPGCMARVLDAYNRPIVIRCILPDATVRDFYAQGVKEQ